MNYFCSFAEFDKFIAENQVDMSLGIKCNLELMLKEAKETFEIRK